MYAFFFLFIYIKRQIILEGDFLFYTEKEISFNAGTSHKHPFWNIFFINSEYNTKASSLKQTSINK